MEPSEGSTSCPSSAFYSATQSPSSSDFIVDDTQITISVQPSNAHLPGSPPDLSSPPSFSLRHFVEQLPGTPTLYESDPDIDTCRGPSRSWNSDLDRIKHCDVYIGFNGRKSLLLRLVKWLLAELQMQGISCFASDRRRCANAFDHTIARASINMASLGVVIITPISFSNPYCIEEMHVFLQRKRLIPIFLGVSKDDCIARDIVERRGEIWERLGGELWTAYGGIEREWKEVIDGLLHVEFKLEVNAGNLRDRIMDAVELVGVQLGRRCIVKTVAKWRKLAADEFPYVRNVNFIGRRNELHELESIFFGDVEWHEEDNSIDTRTRGRYRRDTTVSERNDDSRSIRERSLKEYKERSKGKKPMNWKESEDCQETQCTWRGKQPHRFMNQRHGSKSSKNDPLYSNGIACVCGESGFGKTELLLEYAYRFSQRYKMVLWVGGEARYLRGNYIKLLPRLGIDVGLQNEICPEENGLRSFADIEEEAIQKVRRELMQDIPFLLVIDNLESENDWWDGRSIRELLPPLGVATHVLISTRLPRIMNIKPLRLLYLSGAEAMSLMKGSSRDLKTEDIIALRLIEEKLGRLPLGLALVGAIISEFHTDPFKLLDSINKVPCSELITWNNAKEEVILKQNPFLLQFLELCFSMLDHARSRKKLAAKMLEASSWFAPSPIPISMLVLAARGTSKEQYHMQVWKKLQHMFSCTCMPSYVESSDAEASSMLITLGMGRTSAKTGSISFHDIIKEYAKKRGSNKMSISAVKAISIEGSIPEHFDHIWAACFLLFKFGTDPVVVNLPTHDLLYFIKRSVLPLVSWSYTVFFKYNDILELLRLSTEALEALEDSFIDEANAAQQKSSCLSGKNQSIIASDPILYQDLAHLRAILLETRARLMLKGGQYDIARQLCQTAVSIKEVIYGREHPETQSTRETFERVMKYQSKF
ncbi:uncharacterized protein [Typha latifolia]|uniref:uncharacterized protein n=1 Tax=Typha latifolia TaxID=4733 RepID=UPI003C30077C